MYKKAIEKQIRQIQSKIDYGKLSSTLSGDTGYAYRTAMRILEDIVRVVKEMNPPDGMSAFVLIKAEFDKQTKALKKQAEEAELLRNWLTELQHILALRLKL